MSAFEKLIVTIASIAMLAISVVAQPPDTLWTNTFGGDDYDYGNAVVQTSDGGFAILGSTASYGAGNFDVWLIKTDADGNEIWNHTYGASGSDKGLDIRSLPDRGFIISATKTIALANKEIFLIRTNENGDELWSRTYGGDQWDLANGMDLTEDGGYIITGSIVLPDQNHPDMFLLKTDAEGNILWYHNYGGEDGDEGKCVRQTMDGGFIVVGQTQSFGAGQYDVWLVKTDDNGVEEWTRTFGGTGFDVGSAVLQMEDGGYMITGRLELPDSDDSDAWLIRTDDSGAELWTHQYGGTEYDHASSIRQTFNSNYVIAGDTRSFGAGESDAWLIKVDSNGDEIWSDTYGESGYDGSKIAVQTMGGGYVLVGSTILDNAYYQNVFAVRIDTDEPQPTITLTPYNSPILIPATGGQFTFSAIIYNPTDAGVTLDAWSQFVLEDGSTGGPVILRQDITIQPEQTISVDMTQAIPGYVPYGTYYYRGNLGSYPDIAAQPSQFPFEKLPAADVSNPQ